ncbi:MAG: 30S ribosomal protein S7 [Candidatus Thermoplasmatota archaeon]
MEEEKKKKKIKIPNFLVFDKYDLSDIKIEDKSLANYINIEPKFVLHSYGKYGNKRFGKKMMSIVERLINGMMRTEHATGEKARAYRIVKDAFKIIEERTKANPIQILINALENGAPKEEITHLKYGGISVPKAVDISSSRRLDIALRNICKGSLKASRRNKKKIEFCLADEILLAAKNEMASYSISKKEELERVAASAR